MSFSIQTITENGFLITRLSDNNSQTSVDILPAYGALLHAFRVNTKEGSFNIIDNYPDKDSADKQLSTSFKSSKLSPFVCRIPDGKYEWEDKPYEFTTKFMDGSSIHGLLYNKPFNVVDRYSNDNLASVRLKYHYKKEDPGYPNDYTCEVVYTLHPENVIQLETTVLNLGDEPIPIADGWHPYFTLDGKINDWEMQFASDAMLEFDEKLIPTGKLLYEPSFIEPRLIADRFLDNCFFLQQEEGAPVCTLHNPSNGLILSFFTNSNYPYLQIYTPDHRGSIAIENLSGAPDCFNNGIGLKVLLPRRSETFNVWYKAQVS